MAITLASFAFAWLASGVIEPRFPRTLVFLPQETLVTFLVMLAGGVIACGVALPSGVVALSVAGTQVWPWKPIAIRQVMENVMPVVIANVIVSPVVDTTRLDGNESPKSRLPAAAAS